MTSPIEPSDSIGLYIVGTPGYGNSDDIIVGSGSEIGVYIAGILATGNGSDSIAGFGGSDGIVNFDGSVVDTGTGSDTIVGSGGAFGIYNSGVIRCGEGGDIVDALNGGFGGAGAIDLGRGADMLKGFSKDGLGSFYGGSGIDAILLGEGVYTVAAFGSAWLLSKGDTTMTINEFEKIGGSSAGLFDLSAGTFAVAANGSGAFA